MQSLKEFASDEYLTNEQKQKILLILKKYPPFNLTASCGRSPLDGFKGNVVKNSIKLVKENLSQPNYWGSIHFHKSSMLIDSDYIDVDELRKIVSSL